MWFTEMEELDIEFQQYLQETIATSEAMDHEELLEFYPKFKNCTSKKIVELNKRQRQIQKEQDLLDEEEFHNMWYSLCEAVTTTTAQQTDTIFEQYMNAHESRASAAERRHKSQAAKARRMNLHNHERPNAKLTAIINPKPKTNITALKTPAGTLATSAAACARVLTRHYANISKQPPRQRDRQEEVLGKLKPNLTEPIHADLGSNPITAAETKKAIKHMTPSTSPGKDGMTINLYQKYRNILAPFLARVFNAIFALNKVPKQMLDGLIVPLYKQDGDLSEAVNYRPITLLDTDYRILAKVLSNRLLPFLCKLISPSQTAFIPGRKIGENIITLKLLAKLLKKRLKTVLVAVCDIKKAYDTVDREFLFAAMEKLGVPLSFIKWVKILLSNTKAAAVVHGHVAQMQTFEAGVRQGCPLSPSLYLFIAEVMLQVLKDAGVGFEIQTPTGPMHMVAIQFADDLKATLEDELQVPKFKEAMELIKSAMNQELQDSKTGLLPAGKAMAICYPSEIHGFAVKPSVKALGIIFNSGDKEAEAHWESSPSRPKGALLEKLEKRCSNLAGCNLTMFGRAFCTATYLTSVMLYHATFVEVPPRVQKRAEECIAKLVNRNISPSTGGQHFTGPADDLLPGHPTTGGFGALPLEQHIQARRAKWMLELAYEDHRPWKQLALTAIADANPSVPALTTLLDLMDSSKSDQNRLIIRKLPKALEMLVDGLYCLPPLVIAPGDWCYSTPLFGNELLQKAATAYEESTFGDIAFTNLKTLGQLVEASRAVNGLPRSSHQQYMQVAGQYFGGAERWAYKLPDQHTAGTRLLEMVSKMPIDWVKAAYSASKKVRNGSLSGALPQPGDSAGIALATLGWKLSNGTYLKIQDYTVKWGTQQQLKELQQKRNEVLREYALLADDGTDGAEVVLDFMRRSWKLKWENNYKEILWLLAHNGVALARRMGEKGKSEVCACGKRRPGRKHHFWNCQVLQGLKASMASQLTEATTGTAIQPKHIWLGISPSEHIEECVWTVVSLAALNAMETAKAFIWTKLKGQSACENVCQQANNAAITKFWSLLSNFVGLRHTQPCWEALPAGHPFLHWHDGKLRVNKIL